MVRHVASPNIIFIHSVVNRLTSVVVYKYKKEKTDDQRGCPSTIETKENNVAITEHTLTYLGGYGTEEQQQAFQDASNRLEAVYREQHPDDLEDMQSILEAQYLGAADYALGDVSLESMAEMRKEAERDRMIATDTLRGACVVAFEQGMSKSEIARRSGVSRPTLDAWFGFSDPS